VCGYRGAQCDSQRRLLKITGLFCKRALQKRRYSAKDRYRGAQCDSQRVPFVSPLRMDSTKQWTRQSRSTVDSTKQIHHAVPERGGAVKCAARRFLVGSVCDIRTRCPPPPPPPPLPPLLPAIFARTSLFASQATDPPPPLSRSEPKNAC